MTKARRDSVDAVADTLDASNFDVNAVWVVFWDTYDFTDNRHNLAVDVTDVEAVTATHFGKLTFVVTTLTLGTHRAVPAAVLAGVGVTKSNNWDD